MADAAKLAISISADDKASAVMGRLQNSLGGLRKAGMAMTAAGGAIVGIFGMAGKSAAEFEGGMREVNSMMGLGQAEFQAMSDQVLDLSKDIGVDAVASTKALYQAISAGMPKENVVDFMAIATKAAIAGVTETEVAVDGLTTVMNAFKLPMSDAQKVADIMFTTVKGGKTTLEELAASMFNVAPIAASAGVEFGVVSAALATMTKQGVPTAQATTQLRQAMVALMKPTVDMATIVDKLGYASSRAMLDELGLAKTLDTLREATGGSDEMLMKMFGSVEAGSAVLALTGKNAEMFAADLVAIKSATKGAGAATDAFNEINKGAGRQFEAMKEKMKGVLISLGQQFIPLVTTLATKISGVVEKIIAWMKENPQLAKMITLVAGAIGVLMLALGPLLVVLPGIVAALPVLGAAFAAITGPIGIVVGAIAGLVAIGVLVYKNWDTIKAKTVEIWESIVDFFKGIPEKIGAAFSTVKDIILSPFRAAWTGIGIGLNWLINQINKIKFTFPDWIPGIGGKGWEGFNIPAVELPSFKNGGIVPGMIGQPVPILAHGGERVSSNGGGTPVFNIYVAGSILTERDLRDTLREAFIDIKLANTTTGF